MLFKGQHDSGSSQQPAARPGLSGPHCPWAVALVSEQAASLGRPVCLYLPPALLMPCPPTSAQASEQAHYGRDGAPAFFKVWIDVERPPRSRLPGPQGGPACGARCRAALLRLQLVLHPAPAAEPRGFPLRPANSVLGSTAEEGDGGAEAAVGGGEGGQARFGQHQGGMADIWVNIRVWVNIKAE